VGAIPHPRLRPLLAREYTGFTEATGPRHLVLPATTSVRLVVKLRDSAHRPPAFVKGADEHHTVVQGECAPSYVEVRLAPLGGYALFGRPLTELRGQLVDLTDLLGPAGRRLAEQLPDIPSWDRRFRLLDLFLLDRLDRGAAPAPEVSRAWQLMVGTAGAVPIGRIAQDVGWSHKHLITRFTQQVGLAPKSAARLVRFDRVLRSLARPQPPRWDRIAAESGYADQSHLVRDFRRFTGTTPTDFAARIAAAGGR